MFVISVAVPVPLRRHFDYTHTSELKVGTRVLVEFGTRELVGIVLDCKPQLDSHTETLKPLLTVLDDANLVDQELTALAKWMADYYHHPIGETYATLLPTWIRSNKTSGDLYSLIRETYCRLTEDGHSMLEKTSSLRASQRACLASLEEGPLPRKTMLTLHSPHSVLSLKKKALLEEFTQVSNRLDSALVYPSVKIESGPFANAEQGVAIAAINATHSRFSVSLLHGVTGSGKTEVYLQALEGILLQGKQALILVPEIGLTPQTVKRFSSRFQCDVGVLSSAVTNRQRAKIWLQAKLGLLPIIIGTRSAVFTPFLKLGIIIIDEEHDDALKQQDGLRYHARDVAAIRARNANIPLVLGSATPSLETLNNALTGRYKHLRLTQRAANAQTVDLHLLDIKHQPIHSGLSELAIEHIRQHLTQGNQVLVFLNRRGYSPMLMCHECGHVECCHQCERPMTWHKHLRRLECHQCDVQRAVPSACSHCNSRVLLPEGLGTEQLEDTLRNIFPHYKTARIDRDNTRKKDAFNDMLDDIHKGKTRILIGTQMLAKGHHFPNVTLVVVVDADSGLFSLDVRAQEKLAQLVTQISGRAGRASKKGETILQTHHPEHPILQELVYNGYEHVANLLLKERQALNAPPHFAQAVIKAEAKDAMLCQQVLSGAKQALGRSITALVIMGPMPALVEKRNHRYRFMLVVRSQTRRSLYGYLRVVVSHLETDKEAKKCRWSVDVDAIDIT